MKTGTPQNVPPLRLPVGYQLHSVGSDGIDDGGRPLSPGVSPDKAKGDVVLDVALPP